MRILLVDDEAAVRQAFRRILAEVFPNPMFGEAATSLQARELARRVRWDVAVGTSDDDLRPLDANVPGVRASPDEPEQLIEAIRALTSTANRPEESVDDDDDEVTDPLVAEEDAAD